MIRRGTGKVRNLYKNNREKRSGDVTVQFVSTFDHQKETHEIFEVKVVMRFERVFKSIIKVSRVISRLVSFDTITDIILNINYFFNTSFLTSIILHNKQPVTQKKVSIYRIEMNPFQWFYTTYRIFLTDIFTVTTRQQLDTVGGGLVLTYRT